MTAKKFLILVGVMLATLVLIVSTIFYYIDPLFFYRKTALYEPQYIGTERYQMAGLLKMMDYKTLFTGTSMGKNFEESYADDKLRTKSFNGSLPASTAREQALVTKTAFRHKDKLDKVIWELNYFSFSGDPDWVTGHPSDFPVYMYDESKLNDIRYLFNSYSIEVLYKNIQNNKDNIRSRRNVATIYKFGKGAPKESFDRIEEAVSTVPEMEELPEYETAETMVQSFKENVISLVAEHPETKFTFFFAPYSVYNQYISYEKHPDYLAERIQFKKEAFKLLKKYPNTQLYDFQDNKDITFNIDNYMGDGVHYYNFINRWIIDYFTEHKPIQNLSQYEQKIDRYQELVKNFNTEQLYKSVAIREQYPM